MICRNELITYCHVSIQINVFSWHTAASAHFSCHHPEPVNWLAPGRFGINFKSVISEHMLRTKFMSTSCEIAPQANTTVRLWWWVNIDQVMLYVVKQHAITRAIFGPELYRHMASGGHNELNRSGGLCNMGYPSEMHLKLKPHDDVIKWKHFPRYWPFVRSPVNSPHKKASDAELWCFLWSASEQAVE